MLQYLNYREIGYTKGIVMQRAEESRRTYALQQSRSRDLLSPHRGSILCMDIDRSDCRYLLTGGADAQICVFDLQWGSSNKEQHSPIVNIPPRTVHKFAVSCLRWFGLDTGMFFSGSYDQSVNVWDTNTASVVVSFSLPHPVYCLDVSTANNQLPISNPNNNTTSTTTTTPSSSQGSTVHPCLIAVGSKDSAVRICDLRSKTIAQSLIGHNHSVKSVKFVPKYEYLIASGSDDGTIRLWDIRRGGCLVSLDQHNKPSTQVINNQVSLSKGHSWSASAHTGSVNSLYFVPNSNFLLSAGTDGRLRSWDYLNAQNTLVNYGVIQNSSKNPTQMTVSNNGQLIFFPVGTSIQIIEYETGKHLRTLSGHFGNVNCCEYHPVEQELYSGSADGQIMVWVPIFDEKNKEIEEDKDRWSDEEENTNRRFIN